MEALWKQRRREPSPSGAVEFRSAGSCLPSYPAHQRSRRGSVKGSPTGPSRRRAAKAVPLTGSRGGATPYLILDPPWAVRRTLAGMGAIAIRKARPGDGKALARIHSDMAAYYVERFPEHFRMPRLDDLQDELDAELGERGNTALELVAEVDGAVVGALVARVLASEEEAEREIVPELGERRLRIEYLATDRRHQRRGVGSRLVDEAESWGREQGATVSETWTYARSPLSVPFWTQRMGYEARSVNLRSVCDRRSAVPAARGRRSGPRRRRGRERSERPQPGAGGERSEPPLKS